MLTTAPSPTTAAAMPRPTSRPLTLRTGGAAGRGPPGAPGAPAGRVTVDPVAVGGRVAAAAAVVGGATPEAVGGRGAGGAGAAGAGAATGPGDADADAAGPPAGSVGSLMVGEEAGLGGRLMRTVSFLG
jgi:hypothetical protein